MSFRRVPIGRVLDRVPPQPTSADFRVALDSVESWTGALADSARAAEAEEGSGIAFDPGSILFGKLRPYLAKVWVADRNGAFYGDFIQLKPKSDGDPRYFGYVLRTREVISAAASEATGSKMPRTEWDRLRQLEISAPPSRAIQQQIADYLDHETAEIDAFIADLDQMKILLSERQSASVARVFLGAPSVAPLKRFGTLQSGLTLGATYSDPTQTYPYLRVANVQAGHVVMDEITQVALPPAVASRYMLRQGDVLLTEGGDRDKLGRGALWSGERQPMLHQNHVFAFRCSPRLLPAYLVYALEAPDARRYFDVTARQSTNLASTNASIVLSFPLRVHEVAAQHEVVGHLDAIRSQITSEITDIDAAIALAKERRAALITAAVTGQIDVTARHKPAVDSIQTAIEEAR